MNEKDIFKIIEKTKEKIAISQFTEENSTKKNKQSNIALRRIEIGFVMGILLMIGSVGAYTSIKSNKEILNKFGINISEKYEEKKTETEATVDTEKFNGRLISAACDSTCIVLEMEFKLNTSKYQNIDFDITNLNINGKDIHGSTKDHLIITQNANSSITENGTIKLFKYIAIKDPILAADGFLSDLFENSDQANCKIEFSELYDVNSKEIISKGQHELEFTLYGMQETNFVQVLEERKIKDVEILIEYISKSSLGNNIILSAKQQNFSSDKDNSIQKLEFIIKDKNGKQINIVSSTFNITSNPENTSEVGIEYTLKLDDLSENLDYDIDCKIGEKINIETKKFEQVIEKVRNSEYEIEEKEDNDFFSSDIGELLDDDMFDDNEIMDNNVLENDEIIDNVIFEVNETQKDNINENYETLNNNTFEVDEIQEENIYEDYEYNKILDY